MRVIVSGGGTAGHINPAIAIAKKILSEDPSSRILFAGTPKGMENRLVEKEGFPIRHVKVLGFQRKITLHNLWHNVKAAYYAVTSVSHAEKLIEEFFPDIVIGTGGYVSWPLLRAAAKRKIPTLIHEQNAVPGITTRKLSAYVDRVMISFEDTTKFLRFPERAVYCGNPVNPAVLCADKQEERKRLGVREPFLLSCGGSLGARPINEAVYELMKEYSLVSGIRHVHSFGTGSFPLWQEKARTDGLWGKPKLSLCDYIYDMPSQMAASDLVIARAGAITLSELAILKKPAILIPSPYVTDNHQYKNAKVFSDAGAAVLIEEKDLTPALLRHHVERILSDDSLRAKMAKAMGALARPGAQDVIYSQIVALVKKERKT